MEQAPGCDLGGIADTMDDYDHFGWGRGKGKEKVR